jgi:arginase
MMGHAPPRRRRYAARVSSYVVVGVPTALGGHLAGMEHAPAGLRGLGLVERLGDALRAEVVDAGDVPIEPGFREDPDRRAKNRQLICDFLPRAAELVAAELGGGDSGDARLIVVGGDCTAHAGAIAGLRRRHPERRLALAWFDAHGDFNTPDTTPSGNVWGMPFAMICGRGDPDLVGACDGPTVRDEDAALLGGQVLDETESRMLAASGVAHFGAGMLATAAGRAALEGWAQAKATEVDGLYIAVDHDVLDGAGGWAIQMPEPDGLELPTAVAAVRMLGAAIPVVGVGATGINLGNGDGPQTLEAVVSLAEAAFEG